MRVHRARLLATSVVLALALIAGACGDDDDTSASDPAESDVETEDTAAEETPAEAEAEETSPADEGEGTEEPPPSEAAGFGQADTNGDGEVVIGVLSSGDTTDGGYFQGLVDEAEGFAGEQGDAWRVINVDQVAAADARQQMENLLAQSVDIFVLGGGDQLYPQLRELVAEGDWGDTVFVVTGAQDRTPDPVIKSLTDNNDVISFTAGVAAGLALQESGGETAGIIGFDGSDPFIVASAAMQAGVESVVPEAEFLVSTVGPDPNDVAASSEAAIQMIAQGVDVIYPFLGGGADAVIQEANDAGVDVFATSLDRCDEDGIDVYASILFQPGAYFRIALDQLVAGTYEPGGVYEVQPSEVAVGAKLCDPSPEAQSALEAVYADMASGTIDAEALRMEIQAEG